MRCHDWGNRIISPEWEKRNIQTSLSPCVFACTCSSWSVKLRFESTDILTHSFSKHGKSCSYITAHLPVWGQGKGEKLVPPSLQHSFKPLKPCSITGRERQDAQQQAVSCGRRWCLHICAMALGKSAHLNIASKLPNMSRCILFF